MHRLVVPISIARILSGKTVNLTEGYPCMCNIRSDDSVSICRLSQSYVSSNTFQGIIEVSPRPVRDQGFLNTRVMSWMTSRVKLSDDVVSRFSIKSRALET